LALEDNKMYLKNILKFVFVDIYLFNPFVMKNRKNKNGKKEKTKTCSGKNENPSEHVGPPT